MARKAMNEAKNMRFYRWVLFQRKGCWYADGRGNTPDLGRQSLGVTDPVQALEALYRLDLLMAVQNGRADRSELDHDGPTLELSAGRDLYLKKLAAPSVTGGASRKTQQRYQAVLDKFLPFAQRHGVQQWNHVTRRIADDYLAWLKQEGYADRTLYLEGTLLKQLLKWLVGEGLLPPSARVALRLKKPQDSPTYCWRPEEVSAMLEYCRTRPGLIWLADVILALACTGLRISELVELRWSDLDLENPLLRVRNDASRTTKNRRDRSQPIHADLLARLREMKRARDGRVFHGPRGGILSPDAVRVIFIRDVLTPLADRFPAPSDGRGFADGRLHSFRHYFCSVCANSGIPERVVMDWLGHGDSRMVRLYYHLHDQEAQQQMSRLVFVKPSGGVAPRPTKKRTPTRAS